jgi:hypothetical protein
MNHVLNSTRLLLPIFILQDERKIAFDKIPQNLIAHVTNTRFKNFLSENIGSFDSESKTLTNVPTLIFTDNNPSSSTIRRPSSVYSARSYNTESRQYRKYSTV